MTLREQLRELHHRAGSPTTDQLKSHADRCGHSVGRSTLAAVLTGTTGLRWATVAAFVEACGSFAEHRKKELPELLFDEGEWRKWYEAEREQRAVGDGRLPVKAKRDEAVAGEDAARADGAAHWSARARGVWKPTERGFRFCGRREALTKIVDSLTGPKQLRRALVVTGKPGVGKSAVLARIVTTASGEAPSDEEVRAPEGSVACAVHAKGKSAHDVAMEIAQAISARLPDQVEDLVPAVQDALADRDGSPWGLVIDGLDEALNPGETRLIINQIIVPLVETLARDNVRVVVATRPRDAGGDVLPVFRHAAVILDLDDLFEMEDLRRYALLTLKLFGDERADNPYTDDRVARPVAARIAELAAGNFLVAGLTARTHGMHDQVPVPVDEVSVTRDVGEALREYLSRVDQVGTTAATSILTALAFAESPGFTVTLWRVALKILFDENIEPPELIRFCRSAAGNFLIETPGFASEPTFRIFHQALNDTLLEARAQRPADEGALAQAFIALGRKTGWDQAPSYLLRFLAVHAARAVPERSPASHGTRLSLIDELFTDDEFLLHADLRRLTAVSHLPVTQRGRDRALLVRHTRAAFDADPAARAAMFSVTESVDGLGSAYMSGRFPAPYRAAWSDAVPETSLAVLEGHTREARTVCAFNDASGRQLIAVGSSDGRLRIWDPVTGESQQNFPLSRKALNAVRATPDGRLVVAGADGLVRLWDPHQGDAMVFRGHRGPVRSVCAFSGDDGRVFLASCGDDGTVRVWDSSEPVEAIVLKGHSGHVRAVCAFRDDSGGLLLASAGDQSVRLWNPFVGEPLEVKTFSGVVRALCAFAGGDGYVRLAAAADDRTIHLWQPASDGEIRVLRGHRGGTWSISTYVDAAARVLLVAVGDDKARIRLWDTATGGQRRPLTGHNGRIYDVCLLEVGDDRRWLATASGDGTARIWEPASGERSRRGDGHKDWVNAACAIVDGSGRTLVATASDDETVRTWDLDGRHQQVFTPHQGYVRAICATSGTDGRSLIASGDDSGTVRLWDADTGTDEGANRVAAGKIHAICAVGDRRLAIGAEDGSVVIYDPQTEETSPMATGHAKRVRSIAYWTAPGRPPLLVSGGEDGNVRIWEPHTGQLIQSLAASGKVTAVCLVNDMLVFGDAKGTVGIHDLASGKSVKTLVFAEIQAICPIPNRRIAVSDRSRTIHVVSLDTWEVLTIPTLQSALGLVAVGPLLVATLNAGLLAVELGPVTGVRPKDSTSR